MNQTIKTGLGTTIIIIIAFNAGLFIWHYEKGQPTNEIRTNGSLQKNKPSNPIACTQEGKLCPDGSSVSRTGTNCEFAPCPNAQIVGGQCEYEKVPGVCKILSITEDETIKFNFAATGTLPSNPLAENLNGEHSDTLNILHDHNFSIKVGDELSCEASIETKGTCTPIIFKFLNGIWMRQ